MTQPINPFRTDAAPTIDDSSAYPFAPANAAPDAAVPAPDLRRSLTRRVKDLSLGPSKQLATPRVNDLTIKDLNDLAAEFSGVQSNNPKLASLSLEDLNSIEAVFVDVKLNVAKVTRAAAASSAGAPAVNVSCCCCTPCCCCAAAVTEPFSA